MTKSVIIFFGILLVLGFAGFSEAHKGGKRGGGGGGGRHGGGSHENGGSSEEIGTGTNTTVLVDALIARITALLTSVDNQTLTDAMNTSVTNRDLPAVKQLLTDVAAGTSGGNEADFTEAQSILDAIVAAEATATSNSSSSENSNSNENSQEYGYKNVGSGTSSTTTTTTTTTTAAPTNPLLPTTVRNRLTSLVVSVDDPILTYTMNSAIRDTNLVIIRQLLTDIAAGIYGGTEADFAEAQSILNELNAAPGTVSANAAAATRNTGRTQKASGSNSRRSVLRRSRAG
ncbi:unnamed protein product [Notodromas monacha]|uniref:Uncharacterized protein n=1 Tax=Notodromas monacha TaxID=399045 RepID=A0A7R9BFM5_9CRUS|nr:unnamed protein product [Notodromas monacha]CAG0913763.1 unnamed protein product [Notodromas monacha]